MVKKRAILSIFLLSSLTISTCLSNEGVTKAYHHNSSIIFEPTLTSSSPKLTVGHISYDITIKKVRPKKNWASGNVANIKVSYQFKNESLKNEKICFEDSKIDIPGTGKTQYISKLGCLAIPPNTSKKHSLELSYPLPSAGSAEDAYDLMSEETSHSFLIWAFNLKNNELFNAPIDISMKLSAPNLIWFNRSAFEEASEKSPGTFTLKNINIKMLKPDIEYTQLMDEAYYNEKFPQLKNYAYPLILEFDQLSVKN